MAGRCVWGRAGGVWGGKGGMVGWEREIACHARGRQAGSVTMLRYGGAGEGHVHACQAGTEQTSCPNCEPHVKELSVMWWWAWQNWAWCLYGRQGGKRKCSIQVSRQAYTTNAGIMGGRWEEGKAHTHCHQGPCPTFPKAVETI